MRKIFLNIVPFACMLAIATGSVVISCASAPTTPRERDKRVSINVGPGTDGTIHTTWVLDGIRSIVIVDLRDRTRKIELSGKEWRYDPETTKLTILKDIPFAEYAASVEGLRAVPHSFQLDGIRDESTLMVILQGRLAISGYDYSFDAKTTRLSFRDDVELKDTDWCISYRTDEGGFMIGEWKPESADAMSYLEAEHRRRYLESWYDRQDAFWFLDETKRDAWARDPSEAPPLTRRKASADELAAMKAESASVMKMRTQASDAALTRELGFNAKVPKTLSSGTGTSEYRLAWKIIEETSEAGNLVRKLRVAYDRDDGKTGDFIEFTIERADASSRADAIPRADANPRTDKQGSPWTVEERVVNLGVPVSVRREWGTQTSDIDAKPTVALLSTWEWRDELARVEVTRDAKDDDASSALIAAFIAARRH